MKNKFNLFCIAAFFALTLGACTPAATTVPPTTAPVTATQVAPAEAPSSDQGAMTVPVITKADKSFKIGLVFKGLTNEASKQMEADAQKHAATIGVELTSEGLKDDSDIEGQVNIVESMITKKLDAIVVAPTDAKALVPPVVKAIKAGIVVINVDSRLDQDLLKAAGVEVPYIGPDNVAAAKMSGDELGKGLKAGDKVVILEGAPGAENGNQRKQGFMETVSQYKLDLVDSETAHWDTEPAFTLVSNLLTAHPDITGIMAANDNMALGAIQAIDAAGKTGKVKVVGFDNISAAQQAIKEGKMIATIEGYMGEVSSHGIDAAVAELQGTKLSGFVKTNVKLITEADISEASAVIQAASAEAPSSDQGAMTVPVITKADKSFKIGLVFKGLTNEASKQMEADAQKHAASIGVELTSEGLKDDSDIEGQVNIVESMITKKLDAIVVAPTDAKALVPPVVKAIKAGIVVINVDSRLDQDLLKAAGVEVPYIGPDNVAAAKMSGDELGKGLKAGDKVVILEGAPGAENGNQRKQGFMETVSQYKLDLVDSETAHWDTEPAFTLVSNLLTAHPDIIGIMAANDNMALGAIQAIDAAGKTGKVKVVGFDNISAAQQAIKEGKMIATIEGYMGEVSSHGIDAAVAELQGTKLSGFVKTNVKLITAADIK